MRQSALRTVVSGLPALALLTLATLAGLPASAADTASIDHAQPTDGAVQLLVSVPGTDPVDMAAVKVKIGDKDVSSEAVAAASSDAVERTSILAIDTSASMRGARITEAQRAALAYLDAVPANVKIGVLTFDDAVRVLVRPGLDRAAAKAAISSLKLTRQTALYDGVLGAIELAGPSGEKAGQRKILVLSDGKDTTKTDLAALLSTIKTSGVSIDVVSLQQGDEANQPLNEIVAAGNGIVISTQDPAGLSAAFADEADVLARQVLVTAKLPAGFTATSSNVTVTVPVGGQTYSAAAYVPVRTTSQTPEGSTSTAPIPVKPGLFAISKNAVFGGVGAIGVGLIGVIIVLALGAPKGSSSNAISDQMRAYGGGAETPLGPLSAPPIQDLSFADQAKQAATRALANNQTLEARIAQRLEGAGMALKPAEWLLLHAGIAVGAGLVGTLLGRGNIVFGLLLFVAGAVVPWIYLGMKRSKRLKAFGSSLADTLQLMSGSLSAGLSLAQSIDTIVREGQEPITSEFKRVVIETRLGVALEDSLEGVASRMESKDFEWVVMAIRIQREVGGNLAELLLTVAATLRERDYLRRHVRALSAEGRLSCYVLGGLPPGFMVYLAISRPEYVKPMYTTPIGWILCAGHGAAAQCGRVLDGQGREGGHMTTIVMAAGIGLIFVALFLVFASVGGLTKERTGVNRSIAVLDAITSAPEEMKRELDAGFSDRVLFPLLSRAQGLGRRFTPADANDRIREKLEMAGNPEGWTVERVMAGKVVGFAVALVVSLVIAFGLGFAFLTTMAIVVGASLAGYMAPNMYLYQRGHDRAEVMQRALPDAIDLLTISVESGLGFDAACAQVARNTDGPLSEEFARMMQEMQIGRGRSDALRSMADRTSLPDLRSFVSAMIQADAFGIPVGQVLRVQSGEIRLKRRQWAEEMAQKVPVKILVPLIFCILPCLFIAVLGPAGISIMDSFSGKL